MNEFDRTGKQYPTSFNQFCARLRQVMSASACIWDCKIPETTWFAQKLSKIAILRPRNGPIRRRLRHGKYYNCISFENPGHSSVARPFLCQSLSEQIEAIGGPENGAQGHLRYRGSIRYKTDYPERQNLLIWRVMIDPFYRFWPDCVTFSLPKSRSRVFFVDF